MSKVYRSRPPKPDSRGYYRPEVGDHRFTVGHVREVSLGEVERRLEALRDLFERQCRRFKTDAWWGSILPWAKKVAAGQKLVWQVTTLARDTIGQAAEEAIGVGLLRDLGLNVISDDPTTLQVGEKELKRWIEKEIRDTVHAAVTQVNEKWQKTLPTKVAERLETIGPTDPTSEECRTLDQALRAFIDHLQKTGKRQDNGMLSPSIQNYVRWASLLARTHIDIPLWQVDRNKLDELFAHWRNRPKSEKTGERISSDHSKHLMDCLWAALVWLDESSNWKWQLPRGARRIKRTPISLDLDRKKTQVRRISKSVYTPEQLALIASELDQFGRMVLGLCVNCAMQPAEVGRLEMGDFFSSHPDTKMTGNWIIFDRPKTHEYGEWILWPEVAALVAWGVERAKRIGVSRLVVSDSGRPWYREEWSNPEAMFSKWWQACPTATDKRKGVITRVQEKQPDFPRHTIKYLRKILPNLIRPKYGKEVADLVNARRIGANGHIGSNGETDRYADRLYDHVADAIQNFRPHFLPFLTVLANTNDARHSASHTN